MEKMFKKDVVNAIQEKINSEGTSKPISKKDIEEVISTFYEVVEENCKNNVTTALLGFGTFGTAERKEKKGVNPKTGESIIISARRVPHFKFSKSFRDKIVEEI